MIDAVVECNCSNREIIGRQNNSLPLYAYGHELGYLEFFTIDATHEDND